MRGAFQASSVGEEGRGTRVVTERPCGGASASRRLSPYRQPHLCLAAPLTWPALSWARAYPPIRASAGRVRGERARASATACEMQGMPMQMDPAACRAVAGPLPIAQAPGQRREAEAEVAQALEFIPGRLFHYVAKWQPMDTEEVHFFSVSRPSDVSQFCVAG